MKQLLALSLFLVACGSTAPKTESPSKLSPGDSLVAQIELGTKLYVENCASCHGNSGEGLEDAPPVVGENAFPLEPREGAKRDVQFHTAADVFAWATVHMPGDAPGSLTTDEYLAIFAFDLKANGVELSAPLDGPTAAAIVLHP